MSYIIHLQKEPFKFSCSHFTIFSSTKSERLHGHNYYVGVDIAVDKLHPELGLAFDFNDVKPAIKEVCDSLDELILIPQQSTHLKIAQSADAIDVNLGNKHYAFPKEDVRLLPLRNVTAEELARYISERLISHESFKKLSLKVISVTVEETHGQSVTYRST